MGHMIEFTSYQTSDYFYGLFMNIMNQIQGQPNPPLSPLVIKSDLLVNPPSPLGRLHDLWMTNFASKLAQNGPKLPIWRQHFFKILSNFWLCTMFDLFTDPPHPPWDPKWSFASTPPPPYPDNDIYEWPFITYGIYVGATHVYGTTVDGAYIVALPDGMKKQR